MPTREPIERKHSPGVQGRNGGTIYPYEKGKKGGRKAGVPNKVTNELKEAILLAAEAIGKPKPIRANDGRIVGWKETGHHGLMGYLMWLAVERPQTFGGLLGRVLPLQVRANVRHDREDKTYRSAAEIREELKRRGLPIDGIFMDDDVVEAEIIDQDNPRR